MEGASSITATTAIMAADRVMANPATFLIAG
jgi:hypothetical protein